MIIKFERFKDVTDWPIRKIEEYVRAKKWKGFTLHWREGDRVVIERKAA